tara:strand:- start:35472 stop:37358 length:1887 start_codon:yes stop_codon:yes gene_type:complete
VNLFESMGAISVQEDYVFVIDDQSRFQAMDLSDPLSPVLLPPLELATETNAIHIEGNRAYLSQRSGGLLVVDISNPASLLVIEEVVTDEEFYKISNGVAFTYESHSFFTTDITNSSPIPLGFLALPDGNPIYGIHIHQQIGFISTRSDKVYIVDLSDPSNPEIASVIEDGQAVRSRFFVDGSTLYTADRDENIHIYDISDIEQPILYDQLNTPANVLKLFIEDNCLYILGNNRGIQVLEVSDPTNAELIGSINIDGYPDTAFVKDNHIYAPLESKELAIFDVSTPTTPVAATFPGPHGAWDVCLTDEMAYTVNDTGLHVFDISNQLDPQYLGSYETNSRAWDVEVVEEIAYISVQDTGLVVLDVSDPSSIVRLGWYSKINPIRLKIINDLVMLESDQGIELISVQDPAFPRLFSIYREHSIYGFDLYQGYLIVATGNDGLSVVSIENPFGPQEIAHVDMKAWSLKIEDEIAYTTGSGFAMVDLTDPLSPIVLYDQVREFALNAVAVQDSIIFNAPNNNGIQSLDISDPKNLIQSQFSPTYPQIRQLYLRDQYIFAIYAGSSIEIFNASDRCTLCTADFDNSGTLDFFDVSIFLDLFASQTPQADLTNDGIFDFFDISEFIEEFSGNCL